MAVKSVFDFKFPADAVDEGRKLAQAIGEDMPPLPGYLDHEVIQDVADPGHILVNTRWVGREQAEAVLGSYQQDEKIKRVEALVPGGPRGFIGEVLTGNR